MKRGNQPHPNMCSHRAGCSQLEALLAPEYIAHDYSVHANPAAADLSSTSSELHDRSFSDQGGGNIEDSEALAMEARSAALAGQR